MKTFLEWVFWRQGSGFSMIPSEYSRIPTGTQLLAMSDESFGSMGFTHEEVCYLLSSRSLPGLFLLFWLSRPCLLPALTRFINAHRPA